MVHPFTDCSQCNCPPVSHWICHQWEEPVSHLECLPGPCFYGQAEERGVCFRKHPGWWATVCPWVTHMPSLGPTFLGFLTMGSSPSASVPPTSCCLSPCFSTLKTSVWTQILHPDPHLFSHPLPVPSCFLPCVPGKFAGQVSLIPISTCPGALPSRIELIPSLLRFPSERGQHGH